MLQTGSLPRVGATLRGGIEEQLRAVAIGRHVGEPVRAGPESFEPDERHKCVVIVLGRRNIRDVNPNMVERHTGQRNSAPHPESTRTMGSMPERPCGIGSEAAIPPLPGERHICVDCRLAYSDLDIAAAVELISGIPSRCRALITAIPPERLRNRPAAGGWSVTEYACHLRDVYVTSTIRLHRARTEDRPALEPMLNDLRAKRFRYNDANIDAVLDELASAVDGCIEEVGRFGQADWQRVVTRLPGEHRTARWLVRHAAHEGVHHVADIACATPW